MPELDTPMLPGTLTSSGRYIDCCRCGKEKPVEGSVELSPGKIACGRCWAGNLSQLRKRTA